MAVPREKGTNSLPKYRSRCGLGKAIIDLGIVDLTRGQLQGCDGVHDPPAQSRVKISAALEICVGKINRIADDDADSAPQTNFPANRPRLKRPENSHRNNRCARFSND